MALTVAQIVEGGLCIGCGLCRSLAGSSIDVVMTPEGRLLPVVRDALPPGVLERINAVCPGLVVDGVPARFGLEERELSLVRYRGHGNPGCKPGWKHMTGAPSS